MKTLLLIRHAQSSWENYDGSDEDRPLTALGEAQAPEMARRLLKKEIKIDAFLSSPALRTRTTAALFASAYGLPEEDILIVPQLYMANARAFTDTIRNAPPSSQTVALFSHNNGITEYAGLLSTTRIVNMPPCSIFAVNCDIDGWENFNTGVNDFFFFDRP